MPAVAVYKYICWPIVRSQWEFSNEFVCKILKSRPPPFVGGNGSIYELPIYGKRTADWNEPVSGKTSSITKCWFRILKRFLIVWFSPRTLPIVGIGLIQVRCYVSSLNLKHPSYEVIKIAFSLHLITRWFEKCLTEANRKIKGSGRWKSTGNFMFYGWGLIITWVLYADRISYSIIKTEIV